MSLPLQTRLLRVLQEKEVLRVGAIEPTPIDIRVMTATNQTLDLLVSQGLFRQDLFYRLNILPIRLPPLRERLDDLPLLVPHLQTHIQQKLGPATRELPGLLDELTEASVHYAWPGNIRELENVIERLIVFSSVTQPTHLGNLLKEVAPEVFSVGKVDALPKLKARRKTLEAAHIKQVLAECGGNQQEAAQVLGISRTTLWRRLKAG